MPASYLKKRGSTWYVQVPVPKHAQTALGAKTLQRSLRTGCAKTANLARHEVIGEFQRQIANAGKPEQEWTAADLEAFARRLSADVAAGREDETQAELAFDETVDAWLRRRGKKLPKDPEGDPILPLTERSQIRRAHSVFAGTEGRLMGTVVSRWLEQESTKRITRGDIADKTRYLTLLLDHIGRDMPAEEVTREVAVRFVDDVLMPWNVTLKTKRRALQVICTLFDALELRGQVRSNPFDKVGKLLQDVTLGREALERRSWTAEELHRLFLHTPEGDNAFPFVAIMAYTGMRNREVGSLRCSDVNVIDWTFTVGRSKTKASTGRVVPVHADLQPLVRRLLETSADGWLVPGLDESGVDGKRSVTVSKHANRLCTDAGLPADVILYNLRRTVTTQMEAAGVEERVRNQIVGHLGRQTVEEAHYLDATTLDRRRAALAHVSYGAKVRALLAEQGQTFSFRLTPKRRPKKRRQ